MLYGEGSRVITSQGPHLGHVRLPSETSWAILDEAVGHSSWCPSQWRSLSSHLSPQFIQEAHKGGTVREMASSVQRNKAQQPGARASSESAPQSHGSSLCALARPWFLRTSDLHVLFSWGLPGQAGIIILPLFPSPVLEMKASGSDNHLSSSNS